MKKIIVALFAFLPFLSSEAFAQAGRSEFADKISVGFTISPDHSFRKYDNSAGVGERPKQLPALGFTTGLSAQYQVNNRFALETGVLLSDKASRTEIQFSDPGSSLASIYYETNSLFMDVPVKGNLYLINGNFKVYLTAGPAVSFFLSEKRNANMFYHISEGDSVRRIEVRSEKGNFGAPAVSLSTFVGAGVAYNLNEYLTFRAEPIYRRTFAFDFSTPFRSYLGSYGLNMGLFVKF